MSNAMSNAMTDDRLEMRWLPVVDGSGRTRMEATWIAVSDAATRAQSAIVHAA